MNNSILGSSHPKFVFDYGVADKEFTANASTNQLAITAHGLYERQRVKVRTTTTLPAPLAAATVYYVKLVGDDTFQLSSTIGGAAIDITDTGTGTHYLITEMTVNLDYWVPLAEEADIRNVALESELVADRDILDRGEYFEFYGRLNLYKYGVEEVIEGAKGDAPTMEMETIRAKFQEVYHYRKRKVTLFKHIDGHPYRDSNGDEVLFYIESIILKNIAPLDYRDVLYIRFLSLTEVDLDQLTLGLELVTESGENITDESGNNILTF